MPPLEERVEYPFQNIRTRNFPWGNGDKVWLVKFITQATLVHPANTETDFVVCI